jgi:stearoyl-CoA desaturase (Delta-9 desaturase)
LHATPSNVTPFSPDLESTASAAPAHASAPRHPPIPGVTEHATLGFHITNVLAITIPFAGLITAISLAWGWGFSWEHLFMLVGTYLFSAIGITVGYHRLFTHKSFETYRPIELAFALLGSMAVEGPLLKWVAVHRRHHQHSDDEGDPHSPHHHGSTVLGTLRGFWHAHVGWIFLPDSAGLYRYVADLYPDQMLRRISVLFPLWVAVSLAIPTVIGGLINMSWTGALLGFIWGGLVRVFFVHHLTWSINSVCHLWGTRPFRSHDESRNNVIFGVLGLGEGWHNNHHAFPTSARHGLRWWEFDASYLIIRGLELCGLAWKVRVPSAAAVNAKLR